MRHAHMVNINRQIMLEGMRADFSAVDRLSQKVVEMVRKASKIRATTAAGTDLTADLNPNYKWLKTSGIISPEKWGNLAGRRDLYDAGRGEWDVCDRWRGRRLSLREVRESGRDSADDPHEGTTG